MSTFQRWTLELRAQDSFFEKRVKRDDVCIRRVEIPIPAFNQFLHKLIGAEYRWGGRERWSDKDWESFVCSNHVETWVMYVSGTPGGYFETEHFDDGSARIHTFGLTKQFFGQGLGSHLLSFCREARFRTRCHSNLVADLLEGPRACAAKLPITGLSHRRRRNRE